MRYLFLFLLLSTQSVWAQPSDIFSALDTAQDRFAQSSKEKDQTACIQELLVRITHGTPLADYKITWVDKPLANRSVKDHLFKFDLWKGSVKVSGEIVATTEYKKETQPSGLAQGQSIGSHDSMPTSPAHWECRFSPSTLTSDRKSFSLYYSNYGLVGRNTSEVKAAR
jgi:hypothetical protein